MAKIFQKYILCTMILAGMIVLGAFYCLSSIRRYHDVVSQSLTTITQIAQMTAQQQGEYEAVRKELQKDILQMGSMSKTFYERNAKNYRSEEAMKQLASQTGFSFICITDTHGMVSYSNQIQYQGSNLLQGQDGDELKRILSGEQRQYFQKTWRSLVDGNLYCMMALPLTDRKGLFVACKEWDELVTQFGQENISSIVQTFPSRKGENTFVAEKSTGEIYSYSEDSFTGQNIYHLGIHKKNLKKYQKGVWVKVEGKKTLCVMKEFDGLLYGQEIAAQLVHEGQTQMMIWVIAGFFALLLMNSYIVHQVLQEHIVTGIDEIIDEMKNMERGQTSRVQLHEKNTELYRLSAGINNMVRGIMNRTGRLSRAFDMVHIPVASYEYYTNSNRVLVTEKFESLLGLKNQIASSVYLSVSSFQDMMDDVRKKAVPEEEMVYEINRKGKTRYIRIVEISDETGTLGIVMDVTREVRAKLKIRRDRDFDDLTQIYNRSKFRRVVSGKMKEKSHGVSAMVMLDLDRFKTINDGFGHEFGDQYLSKMASYLKHMAGKHVIIGRRSGDEFFVYFDQFPTKNEIEEKMREFYQFVTENPITYPDGHSGVIGISAGVAWYDEDSQENFAALLAAADEKLYEVKENGRNNWR